MRRPAAFPGKFEDRDRRDRCGRPERSLKGNLRRRASSDEDARRSCGGNYFWLARTPAARALSSTLDALQ